MFKRVVIVICSLVAMVAITMFAVALWRAMEAHARIDEGSKLVPINERAPLPKVSARHGHGSRPGADDDTGRS
jgi:hypothetical protein